MEQEYNPPYQCQCTECVKEPANPTAELHRQINQLVLLLNERERRQFVGLLAKQLGWGGVSRMASVTGLTRNTIRRGQNELAIRHENKRIRAKGGGRLLTEKKNQKS